jgi:hypothetical protein
MYLPLKRFILLRSLYSIALLTGLLMVNMMHGQAGTAWGADLRWRQQELTAIQVRPPDGADVYIRHLVREGRWVVFGSGGGDVYWPGQPGRAELGQQTFEIIPDSLGWKIMTAGDTCLLWRSMGQAYTLLRPLETASDTVPVAVPVLHIEADTRYRRLDVRPQSLSAPEGFYYIALIISAADLLRK